MEPRPPLGDAVPTLRGGCGGFTGDFCSQDLLGSGTKKSLCDLCDLGGSVVKNAPLVAAELQILIGITTAM